MEPLAWDPALATGDERVDAEHEHLFRVFNNLVRSCDTRHPDLVRETLEELTAYALIHFEHEERLMRETGYPVAELIDHVGEHEWFSHAMREQVLRHHRDSGTHTAVLCEFLRDWLEEHVRRTDERLVAHVRDAQLRA